MAELQVDEALRLGISAHKSGRIKEADQYYTAILRVQPNHADANHNMGVLAVSVSKSKMINIPSWIIQKFGDGLKKS